MGRSRAAERRRRALNALVLSAYLASTGCVSTPYAPARDVDTDLTLRLPQGEAQIERGRPYALLDGIGHYLISLPSKILLLRWDVNDHEITAESEAALREYLEANDLGSVKVRLNQYAPGGEWRRLARNREMPAGWRWTLGLLTVTFYTILPDRFFAGLLGGDNYNPFTNTINLYSDNPAVALHEAAHAKDFATKRNRHWKGGYAALGVLPLVPLWQEAVASNDAISYLHERNESARRRTAYRTLYPAYGTYVGGAAGDIAGFFPIDPKWVTYAILYSPVVVGHLIGQTRALFVRDPEPGE